MANPVIVEFILRGMPDVARAMRSVEQAAATADRNRERVAAQSSRQRTRVEDAEAKAKIRAMMQADRFQRQAQDRATREAERNARSRLRAAEAEAKAESRAAERAANEKIRISRQVDREISALEKKRSRENERLLRDGARLEERTHREQTKMLQERERSRQRFARGTADRFMSAGRTGVQQAAGLVGKGAALLGQLGGGFSIADSVEREVSMTRLAGKISASTVTEGGQERPTTQQILGSARATGLDAGIDPKEILEGIDKFKNLTGDTQRAMRMMPEIAKMATAFGADMGELAENAANLQISLQKEGQNLPDSDILKLLRVQARQGAVGAVELEHMAKYGARLTAGAGMFEGDRATNIATMGAFAQVARQRGGAASPAEAALAAQRFATDVAAKSEVLKEFSGIDVRGEGGKLKDPTKILKEMLEKTGGDVTKFREMGLGERSVRVLTGFADVYTKSGGGKSGMDAVDRELKKFTEGVSDAEVEMRAKARLQDEDKRLERAMIELRTAVGTQLLPEFMKMVPVLRESIPTISRLLEGFTGLANWAIQNPLSGLGILIGAAFAKELALAGIAKLIEASFASRNMASFSTATIAIAAAAITVQKIAEAQVEGQRGSIAASTAGVSMAGGVRAGDATTQDQLAKLTSNRDAIAKQVAAERAGVNKMEGIEYVGMAGRAAQYALGPLAIAGQRAAGIKAGDTAEAGEQYQKAREERLRQSEEALKRMNTAIEIATKNLEKMGTAANGAGAPPVAKPPAASTGIVQRTQ